MVGGEASDVIAGVGGFQSHEARSTSAVSGLYNEHYPRFVRLAFVLTSDHELAEEIVQDAFARVWRGWGKVRDPTAAVEYLRRTVVNLANSSLRRRYLRMRTRLHAPSPAQADPTARVAMVDALRKLAPRQRACVVLRYLEDLSEEDTASALRVSVGTVKSQTHKALQRLRRELGEEWR